MRIRNYLRAVPAFVTEHLPQLKNHKELWEEDQVKVCPYKTPMVIPLPQRFITQDGPKIIAYQPGCGTMCPLFRQSFDIVTLHCAPGIPNFDIEQEENNPDPGTKPMDIVH